MDLDPGRMGLCHNFLLIASSYEASRYVQEQVAYWREHRGMQFFHILDTVGGAHEANENWPDDLPYNTSYHPRDGLPAAI